VKRLSAIVLLMFLTACSGAELPLSKSAPLPADTGSLVRPPWEAYVKAGLGAEKDLDLETLNGTPPVVDTPVPPALETPQQVDAPDVPTPEKLPPKPTDTVIKAVAVLPVIGVGGVELTAAMRKVLKDAGWPVLAAARADALNIQGSVTLDAAQNGQQVVHLVWVITSPKGAQLGDIKQNNPVPAGSLDKGWGDSAGFATHAAAVGIFKLIEKFR
jgi:hypothetical protein